MSLRLHIHLLVGRLAQDTRTRRVTEGVQALEEPALLLLPRLLQVRQLPQRALVRLLTRKTIQLLRTTQDHLKTKQVRGL